MSEDKARRLILPCSMPQGKLWYRTMYREVTGKKDFMVTQQNEKNRIPGSKGHGINW